MSKYKIAFIGLGKLGLPCAEAIAKKGFDVTGYDTNAINSSLIAVKNSIQETVEDRDIIFVAVPTPHDNGYDGSAPTSQLPVKDFNYDTVKKVLAELFAICKGNDNQTVVLISTVLPGTIRKQLLEHYPKNKIVYNPYLIAMGTVEQDFLNPEMIMIGTKNGLSGSSCKIKTELLIDLYNTVCENNPRFVTGTWEEIESVKIFYNTFISNKLALVNMIQDVANKLGHINTDVVTKALANSTKRITSSAYMKAGMGDGGSCHPRDNIALRWLAKELDLGYDLFESIMTAREKQAENMAKAILQHGKLIYFTSDSYKPGTDLVDGSYSLLVQHFVRKNGGAVVNELNEPVDVIVRVHETDNITADNKTVIFDPWRTYPKADNVKYYGAGK
jgi:UDPglucose 6-dehydrogenase